MFHFLRHEFEAVAEKKELAKIDDTAHKIELELKKLREYIKRYHKYDDKELPRKYRKTYDSLEDWHQSHNSFIQHNLKKILSLIGIEKEDTLKLLSEEHEEAKEDKGYAQVKYGA